MFYLYLKVFHIIGVIVWFAGLFYLGRLYVYHREADDRPEPERTTMKTQFSLMERRLYYGIAWPGLGFPGWLHAKLAFAVVLVGYHIWCGHLRKMLLNDQCGWSGTKFRLFNEVPTLLLFSIVFIVVFKSAISWNVFLLVLAGLILVIVGAMQLRAKRSKK